MRVVFVQKFVPHYRLPFFERVREILTERNIEFVLLYADPDPYEASKVRMAQPDWGINLKTRHFSLAGRYLYWTGVFKYLQRGDFVVVEHAAKLLDNYVIFAARQTGYLKMGYFGHGENFQATTEYRLSAWLKKIMLNVDRWFAYTDVSKASLLKQSIDESRVTVVNNTLEQSKNAHLGTQPPTSHSCVFIGGMYDLKFLPLLLEASDIVAANIADYQLHLVGDGPERAAMDEAARSRPWLHVHGSLYGLDRDKVLARSCAILMPGLVGLIAIDSFQFSRPLITSDAGEHSPEIAYLVNGENCLIDTGEVTAATYAELIMNYLGDPSLQEKLMQGCRESNELYSLENMAQNFCNALS